MKDCQHQFSMFGKICDKKAIRQLPGKRGSIPVVALTANAFEEDRKKALDAGMNAHIAKPLNMEQLLLTMGEILSDCIFS